MFPMVIMYVYFTMVVIIEALIGLTDTKLVMLQI